MNMLICLIRVFIVLAIFPPKLGILVTTGRHKARLQFLFSAIARVQDASKARGCQVTQEGNAKEAGHTDLPLQLLK